MPDAGAAASTVTGFLMRLFFGFDIPADGKASIAAWRDRYALADGRPVPPANFHITLAFLGDVAERQVEGLCQAVDEWRAGADARAVFLTLDRVGYFPKPGIYWLGASGDTTDAAAIARKLGSLGQRVGARRDRRAYVPHVTLYRRCATPPPAVVREPRLALELDEFTLFESSPGRDGVRYEPLASWSLL